MVGLRRMKKRPQFTEIRGGIILKRRENVINRLKALRAIRTKRDVVSIRLIPRERSTITSRVSPSFVAVVKRRPMRRR